jgi:hypothetical protein
LLLRVGCRPAHGRTAAAGQLVAFERRENLAGPFDHRQRQAGEARDLNPETAIGTAGHDFAQKDDVVFPLSCSHVIVHDAGRGIGQIRQLVVVRSEERLRTKLGIGRQMLGNCPGEAQAIEGRGAAANLVEHDEAS